MPEDDLRRPWRDEAGYLLRPCVRARPGPTPPVRSHREIGSARAVAARFSPRPCGSDSAGADARLAAAAAAEKAAAVVAAALRHARVAAATARVAAATARATARMGPRRTVELGGATAVQSQNPPTNRGDCHATCEPNSKSPSTAECATVFWPAGGAIREISAESFSVALNTILVRDQDEPFGMTRLNVDSHTRRGFYADASKISTIPNSIRHAFYALHYQDLERPEKDRSCHSQWMDFAAD
jgi:hypothetical protein